MTPIFIVESLFFEVQEDTRSAQESTMSHINAELFISHLLKISPFLAGVIVIEFLDAVKARLE
jgi:hypothetical protein